MSQIKKQQPIKYKSTRLSEATYKKVIRAKLRDGIPQTEKALEVYVLAGIKAVAQANKEVVTAIDKGNQEALKYLKEVVKEAAIKKHSPKLKSVE